MGNQPQLILSQRSQWTHKDVSNIVPAGKNYPVNGDFGDYVPLFLIPFISTTNSGYSYSSNDYPSRLNSFYGSLDVTTPLHENVRSKIGEMNVASNNARIAFFETYTNLITGYSNSEDTISPVDYTFGMYYKHDQLAASYEQIFVAQSGLTPSLVRLRSQAYYSGRGSLFTDKGNLIWTLAVKKDHVKYVKLCHLLGKPIDPKVLVFITQTDFDTKTTFNKPLRTNFRKHMKGWLVDNDVTMIEMDFNEMLCGRVTVPEEVSSIRDMKTWETDTVNNFVESYRVENALSDAGVELSF